MPIDKKFRTIPAPNLASYDFYDLFTGTGYKLFYLWDGYHLASSKKLLTTDNSMRSQTGLTTSAGALDVDFDLAFEVPIHLEGEAQFLFFVGTDQTDTWTFKVNLKHVDAANNETQIGTETSGAVSCANNVVNFSGVYTIPLTTFKAGEKLRVIFSNVSRAKTIKIFHDPTNRTDMVSGVPVGNMQGTASKILLPLKL